MKLYYIYLYAFSFYPKRLTVYAILFFQYYYFPDICDTR